MDLFKFRWQHSSKVYKGLLYSLAIWFVGIIVILILLLLNILPMSIEATLVIIWVAIEFILIMEIEYRRGRIDQKYLNEMNEIRIKMKLKSLKDI